LPQRLSLVDPSTRKVLGNADVTADGSFAVTIPLENELPAGTTRIFELTIDHFRVPADFGEADTRRLAVHLNAVHAM
jgi:hypothetical protein